MQGWDLGQVFGTSIYPIATQQDTPALIQTKFLEFLRNFRLEHVFTYRFVPCKSFYNFIIVINYDKISLLNNIFLKLI